MLKAVLILFLCTLACCRSAQPPGDDGVKGEKILFLAYRLQKDTVTGTIDCKLIQQIISSGTFRTAVSTATTDDNDLLLVFRNRKGRELRTEVILDPFRREVEGVGDDGRLMRKVVIENKGEALLRTSYTEEMRTVEVFAGGRSKTKILEHSINTHQ